MVKPGSFTVQHHAGEQATVSDVDSTDCRLADTSRGCLRHGSHWAKVQERLSHAVKTATGGAPEPCWYGQREWALANSTAAEQAGVLGNEQPITAGPGSLQFSVMTYNILGDCYAHRHASKLYREVPRAHLNWSHRRVMILSELLYWQPDVVCLQEVDHYRELEEELEGAGYQGCFHKRSGSRRDGCATFWRKDRLQLCEVQRLSFSELLLEDNVALMVRLQPLESCRSGATPPGASPPPSVLISNTHIAFDPNKGEIKLGQIRHLIQRMTRMALEQQDRQACVAILAGDWNLVPHSPLYDFIAQARLQLLQHHRRRLSGQMKDIGYPEYFIASGLESGRHHPHRHPCTHPHPHPHLHFETCQHAGCDTSPSPSPSASFTGAAPPAPMLLEQCGSLGRATSHGATPSSPSASTACGHSHGHGHAGGDATGAAQHLSSSSSGCSSSFHAHGSSSGCSSAQEGQQSHSHSSLAGHTHGHSSYGWARDPALVAIPEASTVVATVEPPCSAHSNQQQQQEVVLARPEAAAAVAAAHKMGRSKSQPARDLNRKAPALLGSASARGGRSTSASAPGSSSNLGAAAAQVAAAVAGALQRVTGGGGGNKSGGGAGELPAAESWGSRHLHKALGRRFACSEEGTGGAGQSRWHSVGRRGGEAGAAAADDGSPDTVAVHPLELRSSYREVLGEEPPFSSCHLGFFGTCDFIWYTPRPTVVASRRGAESDPAVGFFEPSPSQQGPAVQESGPGDAAELDSKSAAGPVPLPGSCYRLQTLAVLKPPDFRCLPTGLPSMGYGSDHISLCTLFALVPQQQLQK